MPNSQNNLNKVSPTQYLSGKEEGSRDFSELIGILIENKWLVTSVTLVVLLLGYLYSIITTPIFESESVLQIESRQQQSRGSLDQLITPQQQDNGTRSILTEIEIIKSRMTLGEVVENLNLEITTKPVYFPIFGKAVARNFKLKNKGGQVSKPLFGQSKYAWGNEEIHADTFNVPKNMLSKPFTLVTEENGHYKLMNDDVLILQGQVGKLAKSTLNDPDYDMVLFLSMLKARPGTQFTLMRHSKNKVIDKLRDDVSAIEKGRNTGIVKVSMEGDNPKEIEHILNEIANIYVRQNVEDKSVEARKTLEFLEQQLPIIKDRLDTATAALNNFRVEQGSIDLGLETQNVLKGIIEIKTQMTLLQQKNEELRQKFTAEHPSVVSVNKQLSYLAAQKAESEKKIGVLPLTQQTILRLNEEVQVNTTLYNTLLNKAQTLRVAKAGMVGDIRVLDYAVIPETPIKPKRLFILGAAFFLGLIFGIASAFIRKAINHGIDNPELIEKYLNIPVYATLMHSVEQIKIAKRVKKAGKNDPKEVSILAIEKKDDLAIESLRSLRTTLHFAFLEAQNNIMMITGPRPSVGKSFVSLNLATVLADSGKKVLLIDGDLRKGLLNKSLGLPRENGLSELISGTITVDRALHKIQSAHFDFIGSGVYPPNPSELLLHERFGLFLDDINKHYDHVIIDSPPVLAVTDAAIIGRMASVTLMVVKAGLHPMRELEQSSKRLIQAGVNVKGFVFNEVPESSSGFGATRYVYQYTYNDT